jgi:hypothetical protein
MGNYDQSGLTEHRQQPRRHNRRVLDAVAQPAQRLREEQ